MGRGVLFRCYPEMPDRVVVLAKCDSRLDCNPSAATSSCKGLKDVLLQHASYTLCDNVWYYPTCSYTSKYAFVVTLQVRPGVEKAYVT